MAKADLPYAKQILAAAERAKNLVKQILTFSRRGDRQLMLVNLRPVVEEAFHFLKSTLPSNIEVRQRILADSGAAILADPTQMQQVLMNLCTNAAHAMENQENGVLEIGLEKTLLGAEEVRFIPDAGPGEFVKLTVTDTGRGIETRVRERPATGRLPLEQIQGLCQKKSPWKRAHPHPRGLGCYVGVLPPWGFADWLLA